MWTPLLNVRQQCNGEEDRYLKLRIVEPPIHETSNVALSWLTLFRIDFGES